jgi:hypothetical protein
MKELGAMFKALFNIVTTVITTSEQTIVNTGSATNAASNTVAVLVGVMEREALAFDQITAVELEAEMRDRMLELGLTKAE